MCVSVALYLLSRRKLDVNKYNTSKTGPVQEIGSLSRLTYVS